MLSAKDIFFEIRAYQAQNETPPEIIEENLEVNE